MRPTAQTDWRCRRCGELNVEIPSPQFRPWHVRSRKDVHAYVRSLGDEASEWLIALYVENGLQLLAVDTIATGDASSCPVPFARILCRGYGLKAAGFILVHNHPSGDPTPSQSDITATERLRRASHDLDMPLLDHLIVAGDRLISVAGF